MADLENLSSVTDIKANTHLTPKVKGFLNVLNSGSTSFDMLIKKNARNMLIEAQLFFKVDLSGVDIAERTIACDGYTVKLNIVRPKGISSKLPVFIFVHGGGWIMGDFLTHKRLVRDLVVHSGFAAVFINYTLSPEVQYPHAINEIYAVTKWVARHGEEINVNGEKMAIVGNGTGGNMGTVAAIKAKEKGSSHIKLQILMCPVTDCNFDTESYQKYGKNHFLTKAMMKWMFDKYTTNPAERKQIYHSPLRADIDQLQDLPPALIQVAENDIVRDEGVAYGRKLIEAGVEVTTVRYDGMIHDFGLLNALAETSATQSLIFHAAAELKRRLGKNHS